MKRRFTIRFTVISLFVFTTVLTAGVAIALQYHFSKEQVLKHALFEYRATAQTIAIDVNRLDDYFSNSTELLSRVGQPLTEFETGTFTRDMFVQLLRASPHFYSIYVGQSDGDFFQVINLEALRDLRARLGAAKDDRWAVARVTPATQTREIRFYTSDLIQTSVRVEASKYRANERPWFIGAADRELYKTQPYLFQVVPVSGQTYSKAIDGTDAVVGIDVVLGSIAIDIANDLGDALQHEGVEFYLYDETGSLKAGSGLKLLQALPEVEPMQLSPELEQLVESIGSIRVSNETNWPPLDFALRGQPTGYMVDLIKILSLKTGLEVTFINGFSWKQLVDGFKDGRLDVLHPVSNNLSNQRLGSLSRPLASFDFALAQLGTDYSELEQLKGKRLGVLSGWSIIEPIKKHYPSIQLQEFDELHQALLALNDKELDAVIDLEVILKRVKQQRFLKQVQLKEITLPQGFEGFDSFHLVVDESNSALLALLELALNEVTEEERSFLARKWLEQESQSGIVPHEFLLNATKDKQLQQRLVEQRLGGEDHVVFVTELDLFESGREYFAITVPSALLLKHTQSSVLTSISASAFILILLIPLSGFFARPIVNPVHSLLAQMARVRERQYKDVQIVDSNIVEMDSLSRSIKATSDALQEHERTQEEFIESFIKMIAQAIDDKSPYTAGHCNRVPELALMLVKEAEQSNVGAFAEFAFENDKQRREFRIAAWLHDCGKITTPEHIVDKGSKLEANYNRIHEIRTRFEVMIRDEIIAFYQGKAPQLKPDLDSDLQQGIEQLKQEFAEVATANVGGEFMDEEAISRIQTIAKRTWTRYLDNTLGLSPEEERHLAEAGVVSQTPAVEPLLADKPEHIVPHPTKIEFDPRFEIKMPVPEHLANKGEVYNLCIQKGTLTAEDRFKINEHIVGTIKMLERMPFPKELAKVPRYASTHHETMKGTGYPRQLKGEELSIPERIMALADVFEALTAADRPYKKAKSLSESLRIMRFMVLDEHLDKEVYHLFLESELYMTYAKQYLEPSQIDEIDIEQYRA